MSTELEQVDLVEAELVADGDASAGGAVAAYDQVTARPGRAGDEGGRGTARLPASHDPDRLRPGPGAVVRVPPWLAERTGIVLPLSAITVGIYVAFVKWLDEVKEAALISVGTRAGCGRAVRVGVCRGG
ncbi:hypothetical protein OG787_11970 [Streptomyces sp. NBC_00075]|uniref:hypothetical protein n=1 Tax=Streptomyces sp. NBC_00075 TaxID=2975641 RepID=UPI00324B6589